MSITSSGEGLEVEADDMRHTKAHELLSKLFALRNVEHDNIDGDAAASYVLQPGKLYYIHLTELSLSTELAA